MNRLKKNRAIRLLPFFAILLLVAGSCVLYLNDYYRADTERIAAFSLDFTVESRLTDEGYYVLEPECPTAGLIFYPGGKVEHTAYLPLMEALASRGILCVLVEMPFRLAVLDMDAAAEIPDRFPQISSWYIGGHSLGGAIAASYVSGCSGEYDGLVLLGSYSTADLSQSGLSVLSVYGSEDLVMNRDKYEDCKENLPSDFLEIILVGGCHASFGMYGPQDGDGIPTLTPEEQILHTAEAIAMMAVQ